MIASGADAPLVQLFRKRKGTFAQISPADLTSPPHAHHAAAARVSPLRVLPPPPASPARDMSSSADAPQAPKLSLRMLAPLILMGGKKFGLDLTNPDQLAIVRVSFVAAVALSALACAFMYAAVHGKKKKLAEDRVWVTSKDPKTMKEKKEHITLFEHDLREVMKALTSNLGSAAIVTFLHLKFKINPPLLLQSFIIPMNLVESPVFQTHVLGRAIPRPWAKKEAANPLAALFGGDKDERLAEFAKTPAGKRALAFVAENKGGESLSVDALLRFAAKEAKKTEGGAKKKDAGGGDDDATVISPSTRAMLATLINGCVDIPALSEETEQVLALKAVDVLADQLEAEMKKAGVAEFFADARSLDAKGVDEWAKKIAAEINEKINLPALGEEHEAVIIELVLKTVAHAFAAKAK